MKPSLIWDFLIGALLANGMPHFIWGRSHTVARSPFGERSAPGVNLRWGAANFIAATTLALCRTRQSEPAQGSLVALLLGFWLTVGMFAASMERFVGK